MKYVSAAVWLLAGAATCAFAQEPGAAPVPEQVAALSGCWEGVGSVMGKAVSIALAAKPITEGALFLVEVENVAVGDPDDRYAAHLIFGGKTRPAEGGEAATVTGFYADSFGGDGVAAGSGSVRPDGFEIAYAYPKASFVNRWTIMPNALSWTITATDPAGSEQAFAGYEMTRTECTVD